MLILTRKPGESICIGDDIVINVVAVSGRQVKLGFGAPKSVNIVRTELIDRDRDSGYTPPRKAGAR